MIDSHRSLGFEKEMHGVTGAVEIRTPKQEQLEALKAMAERRLAAAGNVLDLVESVPGDKDANVADFIADANQHAKDQGDPEALEEAIVADEAGALRVIEGDDVEDTARELSNSPDNTLAEALQDISAMDPSGHNVKRVTETINRIDSSKISDAKLGTLQSFEEDMHTDTGEMVEASTSEKDDEDVERLRQLAAEDDVAAIEEMLMAGLSNDALIELVRLEHGELIDATAWGGNEDTKYKRIHSLVIEKLQNPQTTEDIKTLVKVKALGEEDNLGKLYVPVWNMMENTPELTPTYIQGLKETKNYRAIIDEFDNLGLEATEIAKYMFDEGRGDLILDNIWKFSDIKIPQLDQVIDGLYEKGEITKLALNANYIKDFDYKRFYDEAIKNDDCLYLIAQNPNLLSQVTDKDEFIRRCIDTHWDGALFAPGVLEHVDITSILDYLSEKGKPDVFIKIALSHPELGIDLSSVTDECFEKNPWAILELVKSGTIDMDKQEVFRRLGAHDNTHVLLRYDEGFTQAQLEEAIESAIRQDNHFSVFINAHKFPWFDMHGYVDRAVSTSEVDNILAYRDYFKSISDVELVNIFTSHSKIHILVSRLDRLPLDDKARELAMPGIKEMLASGDFPSEHSFSVLSEFALNELDPAEIPENLTLTLRYMSSGATLAGFKVVQSLAAGELPSQAREIGVTKTGVKGLEQFGVKCREIASAMMQVDVPSDIIRSLVESELYMSILQKTYRVDVAEFGGVTNEGVAFSLGRHLDLLEDGMIEGLRDGYERRDDSIAMLGERNAATISEDAVDRYQTLRTDIVKATMLLQGENAFGVKVHELSTKIEDIRERLSSTLDASGDVDPNDKKAFFTAKNAKDRLDKLNLLLQDVNSGMYVGDNFALRSPEAMSSVFDTLEMFDELHGDLRQLVFAWAIRNDPVKQEELSGLPDTPDIDDLSLVRSFVEQVVNQETFGQYFADKKVHSRFKKLSSVKALDEALVRNQSQSGSNGPTREFSLIPTRGFTMELSGQVADACWAGQYESISAEFPNITSVMMKRGEVGSKDERLVGSMLMIETTDEDGEGVLVMRGINPFEYFVNKVQIADFYRVVSEYCKDTAAKRGLKPAVVIDEDSGMSGTNRPIVHEFMNKMKDSLDRVVVNTDDSTFNGYDISQKTFAI